MRFDKACRIRRGGAALSALALLALSGCAGARGRVTPPGFDVFPDILPGRNRVNAGEQINFGGVITNTAIRSPRFFIEKRLDEATFDPSGDITATNVAHGTIEEISGLYTAPRRIRDVPLQAGQTADQRDEERTSDVIAVTDEATAEKLENDRDTIEDRLEELFPGTKDPELDKVRADFVLARFRQQIVDDMVAAKLAANRGNTNLRDRYKADALRRLVFNLSPDQKATATYRVLHKIVRDPATVDVSIRTSQRLADFITVPGDQILNLPNGDDVRVRTLGQAFRDMPGLALEPDRPDGTYSSGVDPRRVTFAIKDPLLGAGGRVNATTGVYTAPLTLPAEALNNPTLPRARDIIVVTSAADPEIQAEITVNVVASTAPTVIVIN